MTDIDQIQLSNFKEKVKKYLNLDNDIRKLEKIVREKKQAKKKLTELILTFMGDYNIEDMTTGNGKLTRSVSYTKKPLNKETLKSKLGEYFKNYEKGEEIANYIIEKRDKEERVRLKRFIKK